MKSTEKKRVVVSEIFWSLERIVLMFDALEYAAQKGNSPVNVKKNSLLSKTEYKHFCLKRGGPSSKLNYCN